MSQISLSFLVILALATVHLVSALGIASPRIWTPRVLSLAAGISVSYVFLDLLPDLAERQAAIVDHRAMTALENHVYVLALVGLTIAFWTETASRASRHKQRQAGAADETGTAVYRLSVTSFMVQNFAIGYAVGSPGDAAVHPLWLFAVALGLHFLVNDHALVEHHGRRYRRRGRWWLVVGLFAGWILGATEGVHIPEDVLSFTLAYIAGGTIMNILRHELPGTDRVPDVAAFALGAAAYTLILLSLDA